MHIMHGSLCVASPLSVLANPSSDDFYTQHNWSSVLLECLYLAGTLQF